MAKLKGTGYSELREVLGQRDSITIGNNTRARYDDSYGDIIVSLHGKDIVRLHGDGTVSFTLAGWPTVTTRERINQFIGPRHRLTQKAGVQLLDGTVELDSSSWWRCV